MKKKIYELKDEELNKFIQDLLPVKKIEKDKYGEVFTNPQLINKLLDLFPKNVWSNPDLKWLDPSVGVGFFMIFIYKRLMKGLKFWEPNDKKRSKYIIREMLYIKLIVKYVKVFLEIVSTYFVLIFYQIFDFLDTTIYHLIVLLETHHFKTIMVSLIKVNILMEVKINYMNVYS